MDPRALVDGLIMYLGLLILLTFHEFGHAWMAWKCGDDTARLQGRVTLNPVAHIDLLGTVILPLLMVLLPGAGRFLIGWAKPVPVNSSNLRNPKMDDVLVTLAGPWMNLLLAIVLMGLVRIGMFVHSASMVEVGANLAHLSLLLCFFNLLPIPPLDGSHIVRILAGISYQTYYQMARYGFFILILVLQVPAIRLALQVVTDKSQIIIASWFGMPIG